MLNSILLSSFKPKSCCFRGCCGCCGHIIKWTACSDYFPLISFCALNTFFREWLKTNQRISKHKGHVHVQWEKEQIYQQPQSFTSNSVLQPLIWLEEDAADVIFCIIRSISIKLLLIKHKYSKIFYCRQVFCWGALSPPPPPRPPTPPHPPS